MSTTETKNPKQISREGKLRKIIPELTKATQEGRIDWEPQEDTESFWGYRDRYKGAYNCYSIDIRDVTTGGSQGYEVKILQGSKILFDEYLWKPFSYNPTPEEAKQWDELKELWRAIEINSSQTDEALDKILSDLQSGCDYSRRIMGEAHLFDEADVAEPEKLDTGN